VVVIGNRDDDDDGFVGDRLRDLGATFDRYVREEPFTFVGAEIGADLLVLLGSDWSVYDESHALSVKAEMDLVERSQRANLPIFGICFGGQLISRVLGSTVALTATPEIGWRTLVTNDAQVIDPGPWFQYHFDRWSDVEGISALATTESGPQAYWYGKTLALQFHPEVTEATISRWCDEGRESLLKIGEDFGQIMEDTTRLIDGARLRCNALVDRFLAVSDTAAYPARLSLDD
jgi:GMP synthase-like glutamine amidotransferase